MVIESLPVYDEASGVARGRDRQVLAQPVGLTWSDRWQRGQWMCGTV